VEEDASNHMTRSKLRSQLEMEPTEMQILLYTTRNIAEGEPMSDAVYAEVTALAATDTYDYIRYLHSKGLITPVGASKFVPTLAGRWIAKIFEKLP
jgi:hypothetical protein